jgi:hypothetical protein
MSAWVEINGHRVNADLIAEVFAEAVEYMGWAYRIWAVTNAGHRIEVDYITWDNEWGEFKGPDGTRWDLGNAEVERRTRLVMSALAAKDTNA